MASKVRFLPHSSHPRTVCMRVELYGCPYSNPTVSYSAPPGEEFAPGVYLDDIYDGDSTGSVWREGLGLLTDGQIGKNLSFSDKGLISGILIKSAHYTPPLPVVSLMIMIIRLSVDYTCKIPEQNN